ncbi:M15 family metallopeptidase [Polaribacter ponticola]|uniref:D-alanyl-D-alanine dipeptidase n=1 Tax=Polaribacter ponticola TaxID=2978475 RepID=A0ABT5S8V2_9FLAO|nr:M15 family metallopeptidase [Polaribacter sp. MSW5]MDD7914548.1 M15 family metallopeptidase [Polaribacter sp. MSW5]
MKNLFFFFTCIINFSVFSQNLPNGFVYLSEIDNSIKTELRYLGDNNFIGKPINGYYNNCVIVTKETADALHKIQTVLAKKGLSLKVFDAYRPQQAVNHFVKWAKVLNDTLMKSEYYPKVPKSELFKRGYIASKSGHTRGSTVDLTIVNLKTGKELDMGSPYDFFGIESHPFYQNVEKSQKENRMQLRTIMLANGFKPYDNEWWHFTLKNEPFPKTYFNFPIKS